jgi:hypothetical protein
LRDFGIGSIESRPGDYGTPGKIGVLQRSILKEHGWIEGQPLIGITKGDLANAFCAEVTENLSEYIQDPALGFVFTDVNTYFINAWRVLASRVGLEVRFIVIWQDLLCQSRARNDTSLVHDTYYYNALAWIARDADVDTYAFRSDDFTAEPNEARKGTLRIVRRFQGLVPSFVERIVNSSKEHELSFQYTKRRPEEIIILERVYSTQRYGSRMYRVRNIGGFKLLEHSLVYYTGIYAWLEEMEGECGEERVAVPEQDMLEGIQEIQQRQKVVFKKMISEAVVENRKLRARLKEKYSVDGKYISQHTPCTAIQWIFAYKSNVKSLVHSMPFLRKFRKLINKPGRFLCDSRFKILRAIGHKVVPRESASK